MDDHLQEAGSIFDSIFCHGVYYVFAFVVKIVLSSFKYF